MARALQVSVDELAELLTESESADTTRASSAETKMTIPVPLPEFHSEVWLGRAEFESLTRPQAVETVEALRSDGVSSEGVSVEDLKVSRSSRVPLVAQPVSAEHGRPVAVDADPEVRIALDPALSRPQVDSDHTADAKTIGTDIEPSKPAPITVSAGGFAGSDVTAPAQTDVPDLSSVTTIPLSLPLADLRGHRTRSQRYTRFKRFAAAGVLALVGGAVSVQFITSDNGAIPPDAANPAPALPVAAIPAPNPGNNNSPRSNESTGAPAAAPNKPADGPAPSGDATVSTSQTTQSARQDKSPASTSTPPPRTPAIPAEAYEWSRMAEQLSESEQSRTRLHSELAPDQ